MESDKVRKTAPECCICLGMIMDPKVIPCGHSFCKDCLVQIAPLGSYNMKCPLCMTIVNIPHGDAAQFPSNFSLQEVIEDIKRTGDETLREESIEDHHNSDFIQRSFLGKDVHCEEEQTYVNQKDPPGKDPDLEDGKRRKRLLTKLAIGGAAAAGCVGLTAVGVFAILPAVGFTAGGITAGSAAAGMMSSSAIASGGGVVAGGLVATLQSVGAAGLGAGGYAVAGAVGGASGLAIAETVDRVKRKLQPDCEIDPVVKFIVNHDGEGEVIIQLRKVARFKEATITNETGIMVGKES